MSAITSTPFSVPTRDRVEAFLQKHDPVRARVAFVLDATASRAPTWDLAMGLTSEMFAAAGTAGAVDMQLLYFRGSGECEASRWISDPKQLATIMSKVECRAGYTQIARALRYVGREHAKEKISAAILISDACEEREAEIYSAARELSAVPIFPFQEGDIDSVVKIYAEIAKISGGAYAKFDSGAAARLADLLKAVVTFATGGVRALAAQKSEAAKLLLTQIKK